MSDHVGTITAKGNGLGLMSGADRAGIGSGLHDRLTSAAGERTFRHLSELTRTNSETVRRYMTGQSPSVEFLTAFCDTLGINTEWLLTGRGPMKRAEIRAEELRQANPSELMTAVADTMERLIERVERLELYVQTLETRVRGKAWPISGKAQPLPKVDRDAPGGNSAGPGGAANDTAHEQGLTRGPGDGPGPVGADRVRRIAIPQPKRPRADDR